MNHFCIRHLRFHRYKPCPKCALKKLRKRVRGDADDVAGNLIRRYIGLRSRPRLLNQDAFGVCGMTSVVYVLFRRKPSVVDNLFSAIFVDIKGKGKFNTATKGHHRIDLSSLARGYERKDYKGEKHGSRRPRDAYLVDYLLSRGLGYLFKKTAINRYNNEKADFNVKFDYEQNKDYKHVTRVGTLALRTSNVAFILRHIVGADNVHITRNTTRAGPEPSWMRADPVPGNVQESVFDSAQALSNRFQQHFPLNNRDRFAIAAIFSDLLPRPRTRNQALGGIYRQANNVAVPGHPGIANFNDVDELRPLFNPISAQSGRDNRDAGMEYNHWVVIEGFNLTPNVAQFLIWTWGKYYRVDVQRQYLLSYIKDVIFGQFP